MINFLRKIENVTGYTARGSYFLYFTPEKEIYYKGKCVLKNSSSCRFVSDTLLYGGLSKDTIQKNIITPYLLNVENLEIKLFNIRANINEYLINPNYVLCNENTRQEGTFQRFPYDIM